MKTQTNKATETHDYATLSDMFDAVLECARTAPAGKRAEWLREAIKIDARMTAALPPGFRVG